MSRKGRLHHGGRGGIGGVHRRALRPRRLLRRAVRHRPRSRRTGRQGDRRRRWRRRHHLRRTGCDRPRGLAHVPGRVRGRLRRAGRAGQQRRHPARIMASLRNLAISALHRAGHSNIAAGARTRRTTPVHAATPGHRVDQPGLQRPARPGTPRRMHPRRRHRPRAPTHPGPDRRHLAQRPRRPAGQRSLLAYDH